MAPAAIHRQRTGNCCRGRSRHAAPWRDWTSPVVANNGAGAMIEIMRTEPGPVMSELLESDVAVGATFPELVLVFLGTEDPEVPTVFEPEVDGLLGFLAAQITARLFQCAD